MTSRDDGAFHRAPRPLTGWLYLLCGVFSIVVLAAFIIPIVRAVNRWADGEAVDWMGFAAIMGIVCPFLIQLIVQGVQWMNQRHTERVEEIRVGGQVAPPFPSPAPSAPPSPPDPSFPGGGLVNNQALE